MISLKYTILQASYHAHMKGSEEQFRSGHTERGKEITEAANEISELMIKEQERFNKINRTEKEKVEALQEAYKNENNDSDNSSSSK